MRPLPLRPGEPGLALLGLALLACSGDLGDDTGASATAIETTSTSDDETTTATATTDATTTTGVEGPHEVELLRAQVTIPSHTKVVEFDAAAVGVAPSFATDGASVTISVVDLTHPDRDQSALCSGNHPLNGCATVDYGAFGFTHDNRLVVAGEGGDVDLHLYKDRSVQALAEDLAPDE
ncbi:MAG: hypothetical protein R3B09_10030 [Nannocystaceae bacterium]